MTRSRTVAKGVGAAVLGYMIYRKIRENRDDDGIRMRAPFVACKECGENNPRGRSTCVNCQSALPSSGSDIQ